MFSTSSALSTYFICNISMRAEPKINAVHQTPTLGGAMGGALGGALIGPEVKMSGKHSGLYRYLA